MPFPPVPGADWFLRSLKLQATTGVSGFALQNGTPTIISWTPPSDGNMHRFVVLSILHVTSTETGGGVVTNFTLPDGTAATSLMTLYSSGKSAGVSTANYNAALVEAGTSVSVVQSSALTAGASTLWAEIWGS